MLWNKWSLFSCLTSGNSFASSYLEVKKVGRGLLRSLLIIEDDQEWLGVGK